MITNSKTRIECTTNYSLELFSPMRNHPFQVRNDSDMQKLMESIREHGVIVPILARPNPIEGGAKYEIVSGHRRYEVCKRLGIEDIPVIVRNLDDDEAILAMVDSNLHREQLLPSEKAYAFKMKFDALKRQGARSDLTSEQVAPKLSTEIIAEQENTSKDTIKRYIRLTKLIKPLMDIVDNGRISFTPAVELSYLPHELQDKVVEIFERDEATPSYAQTVRFRRLHSEGKLTADAIEDIMAKPKANQRETVKFSYERIARFFPPEYSTKQMEDAIVRLLEECKREVGAMPASRRRDDAERG